MAKADWRHLLRRELHSVLLAASRDVGRPIPETGALNMVEVLEYWAARRYSAGRRAGWMARGIDEREGRVKSEAGVKGAAARLRRYRVAEGGEGEGEESHG